MKISIKILFMSLAMLFVTFSVNAQSKGKLTTKKGTEEKAKTKTYYQGALDLNEEQSKKLKAVMLETQTELKALQTEYKEKMQAGEEIDQTKKRERIQAIWKKRNLAMKEVLGEKTFLKYQGAKKGYGIKEKTDKKRITEEDQ